VNLGQVVWRKSSRSKTLEACVEVGAVSCDAVAVRDSKDPAGPALVFAATAFRAFVDATKWGRLRQH
jgi:Domain of unknown function (DUF397)